MKQHLQLVKDGSQEERFDKLAAKSSSSQGEIASASCNLISKFTSPGRIATNAKLTDDKFDALIKEMEKIHSSPSETSQDDAKEDVKDHDLTEFVEPMETVEDNVVVKISNLGEKGEMTGHLVDPQTGKYLYSGLINENLIKLK